MDSSHNEAPADRLRNQAMGILAPLIMTGGPVPDLPNTSTTSEFMQSVMEFREAASNAVEADVEARKLGGAADDAQELADHLREPEVIEPRPDIEADLLELGDVDSDISDDDGDIR